MLTRQWQVHACQLQHNIGLLLLFTVSQLKSHAAIIRRLAVCYLAIQY